MGVIFTLFLGKTPDFVKSSFLTQMQSQSVVFFRKHRNTRDEVGEGGGGRLEGKED